MNYQYMTLNIRYDSGKEIWDKIPHIYQQMDGWIGWGTGGDNGEKGIPYWFSFNEDENTSTHPLSQEVFYSKD